MPLGLVGLALCVCVCVCGCVAVWLCGCVVVWLCGCVVVWLRGCVAVWLCVWCVVLCLGVSVLCLVTLPRSAANFTSFVACRQRMPSLETFGMLRTALRGLSKDVMW
jgi:hypothetical protein